MGFFAGPAPCSLLMQVENEPGVTLPGVSPEAAAKHADLPPARAADPRAAFVLGARPRRPRSLRLRAAPVAAPDPPRVARSLRSSSPAMTATPRSAFQALSGEASAPLRITAVLIGVLATLFAMIHLYAGICGAPPAMLFRMVHLRLTVAAAARRPATSCPRWARSVCSACRFRPRSAGWRPTPAPTRPG
ncbi:MAG: hypothetical protein CML46_05515 [Rhodobacteraceae bacterium]|nr:hypothetical protein [Paracoccaceae bacterium]